MEKFFGLYGRLAATPRLSLMVRLTVIGAGIAAGLLGAGGAEIAFAGDDSGF